MPLIPLFLFDEVDNNKLAFIEWCNVWEPGLPVMDLIATSFDQGEQQQLLWGYPGVLWGVSGGNAWWYTKFVIGNL